MKNFRTYQLAKSFYLNCLRLKMRAYCKSQYERAMLSIVLNIAEGSGKPTSKDRRRFYSIAFGSLREVQALLDIHCYNTALEMSDHLAATLYKLIQNPGP